MSPTPERLPAGRTPQQSEERFKLLVEGVKDYAIFMLDANGFVASWNSGAERINGYSADEIIGKHFSLFYPAEARESGWPEHELQTAAERGSFIDEGWRLRKDGTRIWAHVTITALRDDEGRLLGYAKLTRDLTDRKNAEAFEVADRERDEILEAERSARMAAQRATRIKDEFLATRTLLTPRPSIRMQPTYRAAASCTAQVRSATMKTETTARADLDNAVLIEAAVGDGQACDVAQALGVARRPSAPRMNPIVGMARAVYKGDPL